MLLQVQKKIQNKKAYVAGWGYTKNPGACFTNNFGPERHVKCRKYFVNTNREVREGCIHSSTPSSVNKRCKQFAMVISKLFHFNKFRVLIKLSLHYQYFR